MIGEGGAQSLGTLDQRVVERLAEGERQNELPALAQIDLAGQGDVAVERAVELPVHPEMMSQVLPAIGRPHVSARAAQKRNRCGQDQPRTALVRRQHVAPVGPHHVTVVVPAADLQVRRQQGEEPQPGEQGGVRLQAGGHEHAIPVGVGDDFLDDAEVPPGIGVGDAVAQRVRGQAFVGVVQVAFVVKEGFAVGDEVLEVADLRPVNGRVVDLVENAFGNGEPDPAQSRVSGPYPVLVAARPARFDAGSAGGRMSL